MPGGNAAAIRNAPDWERRRRRVYRFFGVLEQVGQTLPAGARILDLGCSEGGNFERLRAFGARVVGVDVSMDRLRVAAGAAPVALAVGERLPFRDGSFDLVYVSHVLHHAFDHRRVLAEVLRVLRPGGRLFLIETFDDNPLMRIARDVRPEWDTDLVRSRFRFASLLGDVRTAGLRIETARQFNVLYWIWETLQSRTFPGLARAHGPVVWLEERTGQLRRWSAHGYLVAARPG